jgi:hypothetical protein
VNKRPEDALEFDQLHSIVRHLLETHQQMHRTQERLDQTTGECEAIMGRWSRLDEQHARALADIEHSAARVQRLEQRLQQGGTAEAGGDSPGPATSFTALLNAFERVEGRLAAREQELARWMADAQREIREATKQLRGAGPLPDQEAPWPLDNVLRLHHQLREQPGNGQSADRRTLDTTNDEGLVSTRSANGAAGVEHPPVEPSPPDSGSPDVENRPAVASAVRRPWVWAGAAIVAIALAATYVGVSVRRVGTDAALRAEAAEKQVLTAQQESRRELEALRNAATRETSLIREAAAKAKVTADILIAPDLLRFDLVGQPNLTRARGQALISRSRGLVFTASRLPPPPPGSVYEIWLLTTVSPIRLDAIEPDELGRVSYTSEKIPAVSGRIVGLVVSRAAPGNHELSSAEICLAKPAKLAA